MARDDTTPQGENGGALQELGGLFDREEMAELLDSWCDLVGVAAGIVDPLGRVFVGSHWQRVCTDFHRVHPTTREHCLASDVILSDDVRHREPPAIHQCRNGLIDAAAPILVDGKHVGSVFIGQFLLKSLDEAFYRRQAVEYGFDEDRYLAAIREAPIVSEQRLPAILQFLASFARLLSQIAQSRVRDRKAGERLLSVLEDERIAQRALAEESAFTNTVLDTAQAMILVIDKQGRIARFNRACEQLSGYAAAEAIGREPREFLLLPEESQGVTDTIREASGSACPTLHENFWVTRDGRLRRLAWVNAAMRDDQGNTQYIVCTAIDITERKRSEAEVARYREHLEELVESRTRELAESNRALRAAKEAAEAANRAKSIFLANMSHELRTPLNAVLGFSQIMRGDPTLSEAHREHLEIINRSGAHLLGLINDVLDMSKIEAGQVVRNDVAFDLRADLQDIAEMMRIRASAKGLGFSLEQSSDAPQHIKADQKKLKQIIINLAGNAVKFTEAGGVVLRVWTEAGKLCGEVEDTGPGISAEQIESLFEPFAQGQKNTEGVGLGLFISRKLVELMGGRIAVASKPGEGSRFAFEVPFAPATAEEVAQLAPRARVAGLAPGQTPPRVLVAEDSKVNRLLMVKTLRAAGFEVIEAGNGAEALDSFRRMKPDIVLMDIRMPLMDGDAATREIKRSAEGAKTPVIIVSASTLDDDRQRMLACGADDFIGKPIQAEELFEKLHVHLGVRYVYQEEGPGNGGADPAALRASVESLPGELVERLRSAVVSLDLDRFREQLPEVASLRPELAERLGALARGYEIAALARVLGMKGMS